MRNSVLFIIIRLFISISLALSMALCKPAFAESAAFNPVISSGSSNAESLHKPDSTSTSESSTSSDSPLPELIDESNWLDGFGFGGYASAGIVLHRDKQAEAAINQISLLTTWTNDSRFSFFSELELERPLAWRDDQKFSRKEGLIDVERLYVDYNISEKINFRAGRFLTPNSRWNLLRAPPLVWTSSRPLVTTRLFPTRTDGLMIHGAVPLNEGAFEYKLFTELLENQDQTNDDLRFEHVRGARFSLKNKSDIGISLLSFRELGLNAASYRMVGIDLVTHIKDVEFSTEAFQRFDSKNKNGGSGAYFQTAVPLNRLGLQDWFWITRLETFNRPNEGVYERWLLGATWRVKPTQLLKFEFAGGDGSMAEAPRGFTASFALFF